MTRTTHTIRDTKGRQIGRIEKPGRGKAVEVVWAAEGLHYETLDAALRSIARVRGARVETLV